MKILFIVNTEKDSGIYVLAHTLADSLRKKGIEVDIDRAKGHYDLIHLQNPMPTSFLATKLRYPRTPIVCTTNMTERELAGLIPKFLLPIAKLYLSFFYLFCRKIICSSGKIMETISKKKLYSGKCVFMPNPTDLKLFKKDEVKGRKFREKWGIRKKMILSVASIQKRKGIFDFVSIARRLPQYQFVWAGKIPEVPSLSKRKEIEKLVGSPESNIIFTSYMGQDELVGVYSAADLFVFPTHAETFGLVIVEAASTGLPIIVRDLPEFGMFDDFTARFSGLDELERKIIGLLENKEEYSRCSKLSLKHSKRFNPESYAEKLIEVYKEAITPASH